MASSRYRSQIFQAFSRQTMRLGDRLAQTWRQAKLTATWGSQILLYPIYAAYQGARVASRSIGQTVQRILPQLQPASTADLANLPIDEQTDLDAPADTPIVRSLLALAGLELASLTLLPAADGAIVPASAQPIGVVLGAVDSDIISRQENSLKPATVRVQGLASLLSDRRLVLTTVHNQLLDVLTAQQQLQLQQRIVWELASYRRLLRLRTAPYLGSAKHTLPLPADSPHLLPPIRALQHLMAWMQQSPIAIATNLFGEAALHAAALPDLILPPAPQPRSMPSSPWARLGGLFRPQQESIAPSRDTAIVIADPALLTVTSQTAASPKAAWWQRYRLASSSAAQTPIAAFGRNAAALPPQVDRSLTTTSTTTVTQANAVVEGDRTAHTAGKLSEPELTAPAAAPTWIETEARLVGYVKHPLEQLLEWLDRGMLWIETGLSNFWRWLGGDPR